MSAFMFNIFLEGGPKVTQCTSDHVNAKLNSWGSHVTNYYSIFPANEQEYYVKKFKAVLLTIFDAKKKRFLHVS